MTDPLQSYLDRNGGDDDAAVDDWLEEKLGESAAPFRADLPRDRSSSRPASHTRRTHARESRGITRENERALDTASSARDRAEPRRGGGRAVTHRKAMSKPFGVAMRTVQRELHGVADVVTLYVKALHAECAEARRELREAREELEQLRGSNG